MQFMHFAAKSFSVSYQDDLKIVIQYKLLLVLLPYLWAILYLGQKDLAPSCLEARVHQYGFSGIIIYTCSHIGGTDYRLGNIMISGSLTTREGKINIYRSYYSYPC